MRMHSSSSSATSMSPTGLAAVHARAAELLLRDVLADGRAHEVRSGERHRAAALDHRTAVPPRTGPWSAATCGITPLITAEQVAEPAKSEPTASWIRAPAESSSQTNGIRWVSASSRNRATLISPVMPIQPAMTVKS